MLSSGNWSQNCHDEVVVEMEESVAHDAKRKWEHAFSTTEHSSAETNTSSQGNLITEPYTEVKKLLSKHYDNRFSSTTNGNFTDKRYDNIKRIGKNAS